MNKTPLRILAALLTVALAVPAIAQVTDGDLRRAENEVKRILSEAQTLNDRIEDAIARGYMLDAEIERLHDSINFAQIQLADARARLEKVAVELYMSSTSGLSMSVLTMGSDDYQAGIQYLRKVNGADGTVIDQLRSFRNQLDRQSERLAEASAEQSLVAAELQTMMTELHEDLATAQGAYEVLVEQRRIEDEERRQEAIRQAELKRQEEERQAEIKRQQELAAQTTTTTRPAAAPTSAPPTTTTTQPASTTTTEGDGSTTTTVPSNPPSNPAGACPIDAPTVFSDTWGAPRSGGRRHQGVDMRAVRGAPLVAIYDSVVWRINPTDTGLGGITVWLQRANGDRFYYAHMHGIGPITVGQQVSQGQLIGYVGSTGNADDSWPHLHFEWHPAGSGAVNPYPLVRPLCP